MGKFKVKQPEKSGTNCFLVEHRIKGRIALFFLGGGLCRSFQILLVTVEERYHMMKHGEDADDPGARHTLPGWF